MKLIYFSRSGNTVRSKIRHLISVTFCYFRNDFQLLSLTRFDCVIDFVSFLYLMIQILLKNAEHRCAIHFVSAFKSVQQKQLCRDEAVSWALIFR